MLSFFFQRLNGCISLFFYGINTIFWTIPMFIIAILRLLMPIEAVNKFFILIMIWLGSSWVYCNKINQKIFSRVIWRIEGLETLKMNEWYMVIANHQSWVDIFVLQNIFYKKIPFLKFFIKKELLWFPIIGQAWWALDFPHVNRYSKKKRKKKPYLAEKDILDTKKFCKKLIKSPVSIMNFVEGTRFTPKKHFMQKSNYKHLLFPKAGGIASVISLMEGKISKIVDVTIAYPNEIKSFWAFICGQIDEIKVVIKVRNVSDKMKGDYLEDAIYKKYFQKWLNSIWLEKDELLIQMLKK